MTHHLKHTGRTTGVASPGAALIVLFASLVLCLLSVPAAVAAADTQSVVNLPGHDACVALTQLGHGKAALVTFVSDGTRFVPQTMWKGKLATRRTLIACGSFSTDGNTDVALVSNLGHRRCAVTFYASDGVRFTKVAIWKGALDFSSLALAAGLPPVTGHDDLWVLSRLTGSRSAIDVFQLTGHKITRQRLLTLKAVPAGSLMAVGDINGDFLSEVAVLSPAGAAKAHLATFAYDKTGHLGASISGDATLPVKGGQLATGDVNGDGRYELVSLTAAGLRGQLTSFSVAGKTITTTTLAQGTPSPMTAKLGVADVTGDNRADVVLLTPAGKRSTLTVYVSRAGGVASSTFWRGRMTGLAAARSPFGVAPTIPIRIKPNARELSSATMAALTAVSADGVTYTFSGALAEITALTAGDVIVGGPGGAAPYGLLRTVVSVAASGGQTLVTTSAADLTSVFASGQISAQGTLNPVAAQFATLTANQSLHAGQDLWASGGGYRLTMNPDGNLVECNASGSPVWATGTNPNPGAYVIMQGDGNLVVYTADQRPLWSTVTQGNPGAYLSLDSSGQLAIFSADGQLLWTAGAIPLAASQSLNAGQALSARDGPRISVPIPFNWEPTKGLKVGGKLTLSATDFNFDAGLSVGMHWPEWTDPLIYPTVDLNVSATATLGERLDLTASLGGTQTYDHQLWDQVLAVTDIQVGPIPVVLVWEGQLLLHAEVGLQGTLSFGLHESGTKTLGVAYSSPDDFSLINGPGSFHASYDPPQVDVAADAKVVGPRLDILCKPWDLAGPFVGVGPYAKAHVDPLKNPWWTLEAGVEGAVGMDFGYLAQFLNDYLPFFSIPEEWAYTHDWSLHTWQASGAMPPAAPVNTSPPSIVQIFPVPGGQHISVAGTLLGCLHGWWGGNPAPTFSYQWQRDGTAIAGATNVNYVVQAADKGHSLTCLVTATNSVGQASAISNTMQWPAPFGLSSISPTGGVAGTVVTCTIDGSFAASGSTPVFTLVQLPSTGITGTTTAWNATQATVTFAIPDNTPPGPYNLDAYQVSPSPTQSAGIPGAFTVTAATEAPSCTEPPVISGTPVIGDVLSCSTGTWTGNPAPTYSYQWLVNGTPDPGATESSYEVGGRVGDSLTCLVTATNSVGHASAISNAVLVVASGIPQCTIFPVVSGTPAVGSVLSCSTGTWTGNPAPTYSYQWMSDGVAVPDATDSTYAVGTTDEGHSLSCRVTASNSAGRAAALSNAVLVPLVM